MDGDLQHDEALLPRMLAKIKTERLDIVVASRHVADGSLGDWEKSRIAISDLATRLSRLVIKAELSDPTDCLLHPKYLWGYSKDLGGKA